MCEIFSPTLPKYTYWIWIALYYRETENLGVLMKEHIREVFGKEFSICSQKNQLKINYFLPVSSYFTNILFKLSFFFFFLYFLCLGFSLCSHLPVSHAWVLFSESFHDSLAISLQYGWWQCTSTAIYLSANFFLFFNKLFQVEWFYVYRIIVAMV